MEQITGRLKLPWAVYLRTRRVWHEHVSCYCCPARHGNESVGKCIGRPSSNTKILFCLSFKKRKRSFGVSRRPLPRTADRPLSQPRPSRTPQHTSFRFTSARVSIKRLSVKHDSDESVSKNESSHYRVPTQCPHAVREILCK